MELKDLLTKPINECETDDLEAQLRLLNKLKISATPTPKEKKPRAAKSNKTKQLENLISALDPDELKAMIEKAKSGQ